MKRPVAAEQTLGQPLSEDRRLEELLALNAAQRAEIEHLRQENEDLQRLITDLQNQLSAAQRAGHRQAAPFRREQRKEKPASPGRKPGHPGAQRSPPEHVDRSVEAPQFLSCPECGGRVIDHHRHENYQTDLPELRPEITRFSFESGSCERCGKRVFSHHPEQTSTATGAAGHSLGPRLRAFVADLKGHLGMPLRKIQEILREQFHIEVTAGALAHSNARLRIPPQSDHPIRSKPTTDSDARRPPFRWQADHLTGPIGTVVGMSERWSGWIGMAPSGARWVPLKPAIVAALPMGKEARISPVG